MTRKVVFPQAVFVVGTIASVFALASCSSASSASASASAPTSTRVTIPASARTVTLSLKGGQKPPAPTTVTSQAKVSMVAEIVSDQPPGPTGTTSCGADDGATLDLVFRAASSGPVLATAAVRVSGCELTVLTVDGKTHGLGKIGEGPSTAAKVLRAAGLAWKIPPAAPPVPN